MGKVGLYDLSSVEWKDFSDNFIFAKNIKQVLDKNKAESLLSEMKDYDPNCELIIESSLLDETLLKYDLIITCNFPLRELMELNNQCRKFSKFFIASDVRGLSGFIFIDFLNEFTYEINKQASF